jgi:hypothetical protein
MQAKIAFGRGGFAAQRICAASRLQQRYIYLMNFSIEALKKTRAFSLQLAEGLSNEILNTVPPGFNNNIIWNLGHLVAAEQGILYVRGGLEPQVPADFMKRYTRGTKPEGPVGSDEIALIKAQLGSTLPGLEANLAADKFAGYPAWTTPYGVELRDIDQALRFLLFHEGMHTGYIMALKRAIAGAG